MNLIEGVQAEMNRVRALIPIYESIGPAGTFAITMMRAAITEGERTIAEDDTIAMMAAYESLKGFEA